MDEDIPDYTADEFLDQLCWMWARDGERFYPPEQTARECMEGAEIDVGTPEWNQAFNREYGEHSRAYIEATMKFEDALHWGFDPIERAAREHRDLMERATVKIDPIDWSFLGDREEKINSLVARLDNE